jgi:hypothetical protein
MTDKNQVGGDHYKTMAIEPVEYIARNGIGFLEGNVIKYVSRHQSKGGLEDLKKAKHYINLLINQEVEKLTNHALHNLEELSKDEEANRVANWLYSNCTYCPKDYVDCSCEPPEGL